MIKILFALVLVIGHYPGRVIRLQDPVGSDWFPTQSDIFRQESDNFRLDPVGSYRNPFDWIPTGSYQVSDPKGGKRSIPAKWTKSSKGRLLNYFIKVFWKKCIFLIFFPTIGKNRIPKDPAGSLVSDITGSGCRKLSDPTVGMNRISWVSASQIRQGSDSRKLSDYPGSNRIRLGEFHLGNFSHLFLRSSSIMCMMHESNASDICLMHMLRHPREKKCDEVYFFYC